MNNHKSHKLFEELSHSSGLSCGLKLHYGSNKRTKTKLSFYGIFQKDPSFFSTHM